VPAATPLVTPVVETTLAIEVLLLVQVPLAVPSVSVVVAPAQADAVPPMAAGEALTVTTFETMQPVAVV
jgi:hypothetical protein